MRLYIEKKKERGRCNVAPSAFNLFTYSLLLDETDQPRAADAGANGFAEEDTARDTEKGEGSERFHRAPYNDDGDEHGIGDHGGDARQKMPYALAIPK